MSNHKVKGGEKANRLDTSGPEERESNEFPLKERGFSFN